jgi:hypothetical protein
MATKQTKGKKPQPQTQKSAQPKGPVPFANTLSAQMMMVLLAIGGIIFLPTTLLLMVGMLPAIVALLVSMKGDVSRGYCVAATNLVGCSIFVLQLWGMGHTFENSIKIIMNPINIIIIYGIASLGYLLDYLLSGMVGSVLQQRAKGRLLKIRDRQQELIDQWGAKVTGNIPLDEDGFPVIRD